MLLIIFVLIIVVSFEKSSCICSMNGKFMDIHSIKNPSFRDKIIMKIFKDYKKHERPSARLSNQTMVYVNLHLLAISSVDVINMAYEADLYIRQRWVDPRLSWAKYAGKRMRIHDNITRPISDTSMINCLWVPDLFFRNGKEGYMHKITKPNYLLRLYSNGEILYSQKITMRFSCQMHLSNFPMDKQKCDINIGSYGYTVEDLKFHWKSSIPISQVKDMQISEFDTPLKIITSDCTETSSTTTGNYACLKATFLLNRQLSSYLFSTYIPAILIVMVSWLNFWISIEAVPARVTLGLLTLLGMLTQNQGLSGALPRVSYIKAMDIYLIACILFIIGALTEFAIASIYYKKQKYTNWIQKTIKEELSKVENNEINRKLKKKSIRCKGLKTTNGRRNPLVSQDSTANCIVVSLQSKKKKPKLRTYSRTITDVTNTSEDEKMHQTALINYNEYEEQQSSWLNSPSGADANKNRHTYSEESLGIIGNEKIQEKLVKSILSKPDFPHANELFDSDLDYYSRFLFPALFLIYNSFYWFYYLI